MAFLALVMFIALYGFGHKFLGMPSDDNSVQLGLFLSFILGVITAYRGQR